ncbi:hypothetical protein GM418_14635 [Maribellus comscasis]|uniref:Uncharacterized protein n=1 Tax=Maribellus comscasis TaxID=2681766 RepID=A0A6I6JUB2_9BACT|nr:hypothetical protein [Maribellus comscasis]QGY44859.1 hypothetical protein GM418_14635 [Maribellus comscasis]
MTQRVNYFLPYMRQGLATLAENENVVGQRMIVPVKLTLTATDKDSTKTEVVEKNITLFGPGDVMGIDRNVISRLAPSPNTNNFETSLVPFIEFSGPDFLWRFSSLQTTDKNNWIPWLALIVLKTENRDEEGEFEKIQNSNKELPPQIQLKPTAILPDLKESWRWAHVHKLDTEGISAGQIANSIKIATQKTVCRLLCPRKLKPQTRYNAFLIPTFKIGAEAATGNIGETEDRRLLTWETPADGAGKIVPYYFDWEFSTGTGGDFENLVRKLKPRDLENMGTRAIDCSNPGYGMQEDTGLVLQMEAALKSLDTGVQPWGMDIATDSPDATVSKQKQEALTHLLNKRKEIIQKENGQKETRLRVAPPVYGEWYAFREGKPINNDPQNTNGWLEELNLDFRHRAAAGLGVQFVKENQEKLMKAAWEQLSKVQEVNQELNLGRFGREISNNMFKRLEKMKPNNVFKMALPVKNKIAFEPEKTIGAVLSSSTITNKLTNVKTQKFLFKMKSAQVKSGFKPIVNSSLVNLSFKVSGLRSSVTSAAATPSGTVAEPVEKTFSEIIDKTILALNPKKTIELRIKNRVSNFRNIEKTKVIKSNSEDELHPVKWYPEFHRPMYHFLREMSQEYILPGLENVPQNTVGLLQTNRRFIEAFMVGLNHEMASELLWREFPTDQRGSYFRSFWDTTIYSMDDNEKKAFRETEIASKLLDDIRKKHGTNYNTLEKIEATYVVAEPNETEKEISDVYENAVEKWLLTRDEDKDINRLSEWDKNNRLGDNPVPGKFNNQQENQNQLVLLIRGELLQKFSNTLIYLVKKTTDGKPDLTQNALRTHPVFEGEMPPDIVFLGFPIRKEEAAEYFVIFEERMTELRFGLDETPEDSIPGTGENDFSWQHFQELPAEGYLNGIRPSIFTEQWNNAAFIAKVMMQKQVRAAIKLEELLPG